MSLHPRYARPRSAAQAVDLMSQLSAGATVIAGGQELMPHMNYGRLMPSVYVDINALPELRGMQEVGDAVSIGALTVHRELQREPLVMRSLPLLAAAAAAVGGGRQVHNRGTLGGNVVAMHPLYDILPPLLALGAEAEILDPAGSRRVPLAALLTETRHGLGSTALMLRVWVRSMSPRAGWAYEKLKVTDGSYGSANAAAVVTMEGRRLTGVRVVIGAVADKPIDASAALRPLLGRAFDERMARDIETTCAALVKNPLDDQQGQAEWRRAMAGVVARRAVAAAVAQVDARGGGSGT